MRVLIFCAGLLFLRSGLPALEGAKAPSVEAAALALAPLVAERPQKLQALFDAGFFRAVSLEKLSGMLSDIYKECGRVSAVRLERADSALSAHFIFETEKNMELAVALSLSADTGKISGFYHGIPSRRNLRLKEFKEQFVLLPGRAGFTLRRFGDSRSALESLNENERFAVASAAGLYVLGAMLEEGLSWDKTLPLRRGEKPPGGGRLKSRPQAASVSAHELAARMIAEDDTAAADLLIDAIGRKNIEKDLEKLGHADPALLRPFLKNSEAALLKSDTAAGLEYRSTPPEDKHKFLSGLERRPPAARAAAGAFGVKSMDWPSSPADLCRVMEYIYKKNDARALEALSINKGPETAPGRFLYSGYKGGAGPGALSAVWLLQSGSGAWYCLSAVWNREREALDEGRFFALARSALEAVEPSAPSPGP